MAHADGPRELRILHHSGGDDHQCSGCPRLSESLWAVLEDPDADGESDSTTEDGVTWSTDAVTVHEGLNVGETTTRYLIVEPKAAAQ